MSVSSAEAFLGLIKTDQDFATRVSEAQTQADRWAILKTEGFDFTKKEFDAVHDEMNDEALIATGSSVLRSHECVCCKL